MRGVAAEKQSGAWMSVYVRWGEGAMNCTHDTDSHQGADPTVQQYNHSLVLLPRDEQMMSSNNAKQ